MQKALEGLVDAGVVKRGQPRVAPVISNSTR